MWCFRVAFALLSSGIAASASATDYYISPSGNDMDRGTSPEQPWQSLAPVNRLDLVAGDKILLQGNAEFIGPLLFDAKDHGTSTDPIIVTSYGTGRAAIHSPTDRAFVAYNTAGIAVSHLDFIGSPRNPSDGVVFYNDLPGDVRFAGVQLTDIEVSGFGNNGVSIGGWNGRSGFRDLRISHSHIHDNGLNGIMIYGKEPHANEDVYVGHVVSYRNSGLPGRSPSGSGIVLGGTNGGVIEWSTAHDNGWLGNAGVGIWTYASTYVTIQHNESFNNRTTGDADGGGFGLDGGVTHSIMQYNFSHGNHGAGYLLCQYRDAPPWFSNIVRHNLSIDDGQKNDFAGIQIWNGSAGTLGGGEIHDNVVMVRSSALGMPTALYFKTGSHDFYVHHNLFMALGEAFLTRAAPGQADHRFAHNQCRAMMSASSPADASDTVACEALSN